MTLWQEAVAASRAVTAEALAEGGPGKLSVRKGRDGRARSLRWFSCNLAGGKAPNTAQPNSSRRRSEGKTGPCRVPRWIRTL